MPQAGKRVATIKIDVDDILVLLRRILRVTHRAIGAPLKPSGMILQPRLVGRALDRKIKRNLHTVSGTGVAQQPEIINCAKCGMDCIVTAFGAANRQWAADVIRPDGQAVVFALAICRADGMDRRQVKDIEPHRSYSRQMPDDILKGTVSVGVVSCRTRKQLIPSPEDRLRTLHIDRKLPRIPEAEERLRSLSHHLPQVIRREDRNACVNIRVSEPAQGRIDYVAVAILYPRLALLQELSALY